MHYQYVGINLHMAKIGISLFQINKNCYRYNSWYLKGHSSHMWLLKNFADMFDHRCVFSVESIDLQLVPNDFDACIS